MTERARFVIPPFYTSKEVKSYPKPGKTDNYICQPGTNWKWGDWDELIPAGGAHGGYITKDCLITSVSLVIGDWTVPGGNTGVQLQIGIGPAGQEVPIITVFGSWRRVTSDGAYLGDLVIPLPIPRFLPANTRIACRSTGGAVGGSWIGVSFEYIELPL